MLAEYGTVSIMKMPGASFPRYAVAETGYGTDKSGYFVLGGFAVRNNNGVVLGPSMFLRAISKDFLTWKSARSWATDIKQWVRFVEFVQVGKKDPPYEFDLMKVDEDTLRRYGDFLVRIAKTRDGRQLSTSTVRNKLSRVCAMQQWFADNGWYHGDLGPRAQPTTNKRSTRPTGLLAHIHGRQTTKARRDAPMGSKYALSVEARRPDQLPRALTRSDLQAVERALKERLRSVPENSPRYDQYVRDELIFNVSRFVGLRVENLADLQVATILTLRLSNLKDTDTIAIPLIGKGRRKIHPPFTAILLRQMQAYAETARNRAVKRAKRKDPAQLFVAHTGSTTGAPIGVRAIQKAMSDLFVEAGLATPVLVRNEDGSVLTDEHGRPVCRAKSTASVHALRHSCAMEKYYAVYKAIRAAALHEALGPDLRGAILAIDDRVVDIIGELPAINAAAVLETRVPETEFLTWLSDIRANIPPSKAIRLARAWGKEGTEAVQKNPYLLLAVSDWKTVEGVARALRVSRWDLRRQMAAVEASLMGEEGLGGGFHPNGR